MPIEITGAHPPEHRLKPGDVIMVKRKLKDTHTKKPFDWTYFALVTQVRRAGLKHIILDEKDRVPTYIIIGYSVDMRVWYLPEAEWPDGVHVFRTKLILEGRVDDSI